MPAFLYGKRTGGGGEPAAPWGLAELGITWSRITAPTKFAQMKCCVGILDRASKPAGPPRRSDWRHSRNYTLNKRFGRLGGPEMDSTV